TVDAALRFAQPDEAGTHKQLEDFAQDRKSTRLNSSHSQISYAVFCLKNKRSRGSLRPVKARRCSCRTSARVRAVSRGWSPSFFVFLMTGPRRSSTLLPCPTSSS